MFSSIITGRKLGLLLILLWLLAPSMVTAQQALTGFEMIESSRLSIQFTNIMFNRATNQTVYTLMLKNISSTTIAGPIYLAFTGITPGTVTLANSSGISDEGTPYIIINSAALEPGQSASATVAFSNPSRARLIFDVSAYRQPIVSVFIATPLSGTVMNGDSVIVSGTFLGPPNVGITVNGQIAGIQGNTFYATVPLELGSNTLTATATAPNGKTAMDTVTVDSSGVAPVKVQPTPTRGIAPLHVNFKLTINTARPLQSISVDYDGDGTYDFTTADIKGPFAFTYNSPGAFQAVFDIVDDQGSHHVAKAQVVANDAVKMDAMLISVWNGMHSALLANEQAKALQYIGEYSKNKYGRVFQQLSEDMPIILNTFSPLQRMSISGNIGEYAVNRTIDGVNRIFLIYFVQDTDGVWRIASM
ncbi:hypothetical protein [Geobacter sp.]|uniref:hypothetical protein n=1 Tax=Geobacter sp. TaxID=46610 RepID=UPI0027BB1260|nr:hypothetical protein [Geobacter sp.]